MVEEKVPEGAALRIHVGFATQTGRLEKRERLQRTQGGLTFRHSHRRTCH